MDSKPCAVGDADAAAVGEKSWEAASTTLRQDYGGDIRRHDNGTAAKQSTSDVEAKCVVMMIHF